MSGELELAWFKSSYSTGDGGQCVEVSVCPYAVYVRDSKDTARPSVAVGPDSWGRFVGFVGE